MPRIPSTPPDRNNPQPRPSAHFGSAPVAGSLGADIHDNRSEQSCPILGRPNLRPGTDGSSRCLFYPRPVAAASEQLESVSLRFGEIWHRALRQTHGRSPPCWYVSQGSQRRHRPSFSVGGLALKWTFPRSAAGLTCSTAHDVPESRRRYPIVQQYVSGREWLSPAMRKMLLGPHGINSPEFAMARMRKHKRRPGKHADSCYRRKTSTTVYGRPTH